MPRGYGRGRGWGGRSGLSGWLLKLLLLLLIREEPSHGYDLASKLETFGYFIQGRSGMGPIYRLLRELEMEGLIISSWETPTGMGGPARRIYTITPLGEQTLALWIKELIELRDFIDTLLRKYEERK